jgi:NADH dehydrogenase/NADH:ubiquinone oxidoreductase subunit G
VQACPTGALTNKAIRPLRFEKEKVSFIDVFL